MLLFNLNYFSLDEFKKVILIQFKSISQIKNFDNFNFKTILFKQLSI